MIHIIIVRYFQMNKLVLQYYQLNGGKQKSYADTFIARICDNVNVVTLKARRH